jgi:hypothetical protein
MTPDGALNVGAGKAVGSPVALAVALDTGPVVAARLGRMLHVGSVKFSGRIRFEHALSKAARLATLATWSSRRRLTNSRRCRSDQDAFMKSRYESSVGNRAAIPGHHDNWFEDDTGRPSKG